MRRRGEKVSILSFLRVYGFPSHVFSQCKGALVEFVRRNLYLFLFYLFLVTISTASGYADWQIDVSKFRDDICRTQYDTKVCSLPNRVGNFATKEECETGRYNFCGGTGEKYCMVRIYCTGYDSHSQSQAASAPVGTTKQELQKQILQSFLQPIFNSIFDFSSLFPAPQQSQEEAAKKQQEENMKQQQEMLKKKAWEDWLKAQAEAGAKRKAEEEEKKKRGAEILAKASISGGGLKMESISGGKLTPFEWDTKKELSSAITGSFPPPKTAVEQVLCAAYFSQLASSESNDKEAARFYSTQMENVMQGLPTSIECKPPKELISGIDIKMVSKASKRYAEVSKIIQEVTPKIEKLQDIAEKLEDVKKKKHESGEKIKEIEQKIKEIKEKAQTADTPEKKAEADDLLSQALALKSDAEKQHQEAIQLEEKLNKEKENIEKEINEIKNKAIKEYQK